LLKYTLKRTANLLGSVTNLDLYGLDSGFSRTASVRQQHDTWESSDSKTDSLADVLQTKGLTRSKTIKNRIEEFYGLVGVSPKKGDESAWVGDV
jgi:hypothetical protein